MTRLSIGDKVRYHPSFDYDQTKIGVVGPHPVMSNRFIVAFPSMFALNNFITYEIDHFGNQPVSQDRLVVPYVDPTREEWDKLSATQKQVIYQLAYGAQKKILAIKYLREISGLGLTPAKYAVENYATGND